MIAQDFCRQRVPATESIAVVDAPHPWGAPCGRPSDVQICSRQICLVEEARAPLAAKRPARAHHLVRNTG